MGSGSSVEVKDNDNFSCTICFNEFDEKVFVPKALDCGHTFCLMCLKKLLAPSIQQCPNCKREITKKSFNEFLTIYALIVSYKNITSDFPVTEIIESLEKNIKRKNDTLLKQRRELEKESKDKNTYIQCLEDNLLKLETIKNKAHTDLDFNEVRKTIYDIKKDTNEKFSNSQDAIGMLSTSPLDFKEFTHPKYYLREIVRRVENGSHIYTIQDIGIKIKHGDIIVKDGHVLFHCALNEWEETKVNFTAINIKDIRACCPSVAYHPECFLKIRFDQKDSEITIMIRMEDSPITHQFLSLCTGEKGPCYKGTKCFNEGVSFYNYFSLTNIFNVNNYMLNGREEKGKIEDVDEDWNESYTEAGELIVLGNKNGSFKIGKALTNRWWTYVIGRVVSPLILDDLFPSKNGEYARIIDSGISFPL